MWEVYYEAGNWLSKCGSSLKGRYRGDKNMIISGGTLRLSHRSIAYPFTTEVYKKAWVSEGNKVVWISQRGKLFRNFVLVGSVITYSEERHCGSTTDELAGSIL